MTDETITNEFLCVLNEVGFDMAYIREEESTRDYQDTLGDRGVTTCAWS